MTAGASLLSVGVAGGGLFIVGALSGFVDEVVKMTDLRGYMVSFARSVYQNPRKICPHHQMMLPRIIKG